MTTLNPVTHVIFDMDGLLINTEDLYTELFTKICAEYNAKFTYDVKIQCMGVKPHIGIQIMIDAYKMNATVDEISQKVAEYGPDIFSKAELLPGVDKLICHLEKHNIPMVICTGSSIENYNKKVKNNERIRELFDKMEYILTCGSSEEVKNGKPAPDAYLVAAKKFKDGEVEPKNCLAFEDSKLGVDSAIDAGMQCVMVPAHWLPKEYQGRATIVIDSLENFKPELFGLPSFDR